MGVTVGQRNDRPGWWVFINHQGNRIKKCFGNDKKLAQAFAAKIEAKLRWAAANGEAVTLSSPDQPSPTVKQYLTDWVESYAKVHCKRTTAKSYERVLQLHIYPMFGGRRLQEVTRADIKRLIADLVAKGLKKQTIHNILTPVKEAYHHAMDDGLVNSNPVARTGRLTRSKEDRRTHLAPLTMDEVLSLLCNTKEEKPCLYTVLLAAVRAGLREGELIGLQWSDIDFRGGFIEVRRAVAWGEISTPKSHKIRRVDMSAQLGETLQTLKETRSLEASMHGKIMPQWVFVTPSWSRWDEGNLRRAFYQSLEGAGLRRVRVHDLRHTYASLLIEQGAHPKYIQEQMGHSSIQVTMDIYGHLFPSRDRGWAQKLDDPRLMASSAPMTHPTSSVGERSGVEVDVLIGGPDTN